MSNAEEGDRDSRAMGWFCTVTSVSWVVHHDLLDNPSVSETLGKAGKDD